MRRRVSTDEELQRALDELDRHPNKIPAAHWPGDLKILDSAGLYSWWVDGKGAKNLREGIGFPIKAGRIYAGQTGATSWPSGRLRAATLSRRIGRNHLRGRIRGSTFRFTLAACLLDALGLKIVGPKKLDKSSERRLSEWMELHLEVAVHAFPERDALKHLEHQVLTVLDPPLNLEAMRATSVRAKISELRARIAGRESSRTEPETIVRERSLPALGTEKFKKMPTRSMITLHKEIEDILKQQGKTWLTTAELAKLVNKRGRYRKKDGSKVTAFQIHGRTRNYPDLFDRDGSRVRLKSSRSS